MEIEKQKMEETNQPDNNTPSETPQVDDAVAKVEEKSTGAIIGAIIIVVLLVIGGLYFLGQRATKEATPAEILSQPDVVVETLQKQGDSDAIADITTDLGTEADFKNLDVELGNIDAELNF